MKINSEIVDAYINEGDVECFRNHWIYNTIGQGEYKGTNIFISPNNNKDNRAFVAELSGKIKNYDEIYVDEIYSYNIASQKTFEKAGFKKYKENSRGASYILKLSCDRE